MTMRKHTEKLSTVRELFTFTKTRLSFTFLYGMKKSKKCLNEKIEKSFFVMKNASYLLQASES